MKKTALLFSLCAIVWAMAGCSGRNDGEEGKETEETADENTVTLTPEQFKNAGIRLGQTETKNISNLLTVNGVLHTPPQNTATVSAVMGGFIRSTVLIEGLKVKKGQVICRLQNPEFIQLQREYLESKNKMAYAEEEYKRQQELSKENAGALKTLQQATADYRSLQVTLGALEEKLKMININPRTLTENTITGSVNVLAPITGYVSGININTGSYVAPHDVICEIINTDHIHVELTVFEKDIAKIKKGQKLYFTPVSAPGEKRSASVFSVSHTVTPDRTLKVHAHLDKEDPSLMPNMFVTATVEVDNTTATVLPSGAFVTADDKKFIYILLSNPDDTNAYTFTAMEVRTGTSQEGFTQVLLPEEESLTGKKIVTHGAYALYSKKHNIEEDE